MLITVALATSAANALYRLPFPCLKTLYPLILLACIFPGPLLVIPLYAMLSSLKLLDTELALVVSDAMRTLPVGLAGIIGQYVVDWGLLLAGAGAATLPIVLLFVIIGRFFVNGLLEGGVKA